MVFIDYIVIYIDYRMAYVNYDVIYRLVTCQLNFL